MRPYGQGYTLSWVKSVKDRGYPQFLFAELPDDLRDYKMHRKAIAQGLVRRVGFDTLARHNRIRSVWKVTI